MTETLRRADAAASVVHDYICSEPGVTFEQASEAIWAIHDALRPLIPGASNSQARADVNELEPRFLVTVTLDGEEWPPTATEQAEIELRQALDTIDLRGGVIRDYTIERALGDQTGPAA